MNGRPCFGLQGTGVPDFEFLEERQQLGFAQIFSPTGFERDVFSQVDQDIFISSALECFS